MAKQNCTVIFMMLNVNTSELFATGSFLLDCFVRRKRMKKVNRIEMIRCSEAYPGGLERGSDALGEFR